jgi:Flp pilus assembly protein CpaB
MNKPGIFAAIAVVIIGVIAILAASTASVPSAPSGAQSMAHTQPAQRMTDYSVVFVDPVGP